jgi:hypothetical protein
MDTLPLEIWNCVSSFLDLKSLFNLRKCCKKGRTSAGEVIKKDNKHLFKYLRKSPIKGLYFEQIKGLYSMRQYKDETLFIKSPKGTGKTLMSILYALERWDNYKEKTLFVVTSTSFTSWLEHFTMIGLKLVKSKPEKSEYLVLHSSCRNHKNLFMNTKPENLDFPFILTTRQYVGSSGRMHNFQQKLLEYVPYISLVFTDECQRFDLLHFEDFLFSFDRVIYISADDFPQIQQKKQGRGKKTIPVQIYDRYLNLFHSTYHPVKMETLLYGINHNDLFSIITLLNSPNFKGRKVVLFTMYDAKKMSNHVKVLKVRCPKYEFFRFYNTNLGSIRKIKTCKKRAVLVASSLSSTEGTNFEFADHAVYWKFGKLVIKRAGQCYGRIYRRNNPNPVVKNYVFYQENEPLSYIRTRLNVIYATDLRLEIERKSDQQITRIFKKLVSEGIDTYNLPDPEFVTIYGQNCSHETFLPYKEDDYTLPIFQVLRYMNFGY